MWKNLVNFIYLLYSYVVKSLFYLCRLAYKIIKLLIVRYFQHILRIFVSLGRFLKLWVALSRFSRAYLHFKFFFLSPRQDSVTQPLYLDDPYYKKKKSSLRRRWRRLIKNLRGRLREFFISLGVVTGVILVSISGLATYIFVYLDLAESFCQFLTYIGRDKEAQEILRIYYRFMGLTSIDVTLKEVFMKIYNWHMREIICPLYGFLKREIPNLIVSILDSILRMILFFIKTFIVKPVCYLFNISLPEEPIVAEVQVPLVEPEFKVRGRQAKSLSEQQILPELKRKLRYRWQRRSMSRLVRMIWTQYTSNPKGLDNNRTVLFWDYESRWKAYEGKWKRLEPILKAYDTPRGSGRSVMGKRYYSHR